MANNRQRILVVFGTRPEVIKLAPVIKVLNGRTSEFEVVTCATAQHRYMLDQNLEIFGIEPDFDLNVMAPDQTLSGLGARILTDLDSVLAKVQPDWVIVQGDTTTVMMAALAAQHRRIRVGHVEAGLRTYDRANPFPEEMNRVVTDHVSDLLFAPTESSRANLLREGIDENRILVTGNTAIDALLNLSGTEWSPHPGSVCDSLPREKTWIVVTAHRRENHGQPLAQICQALRQIAGERHGQVEVVFPVHRNPHVLQLVSEHLEGTPGITLLPPVDYREMVYLLKRSTLVLTDSGGLQEECPSLGKPVLVLRETTERPEAVSVGAARVVGTSSAVIVTEVNRLLDDLAAYRSMQVSRNPFGDGRVALHIVDALRATVQT